MPKHSPWSASKRRRRPIRISGIKRAHDSQGRAQIVDPPGQRSLYGEHLERMRNLSGEGSFLPFNEL